MTGRQALRVEIEKRKPSRLASKWIPGDEIELKRAFLNGT
jgi:hypothetical protein